jgi:lysophospholipase L1-like esterase
MIKLGKVMILGDSYSTFFGYIPEGFDYWYSERHNLDNGVHSVSDTWWHKLMSRVDGEIILNSSWSGTTVCHTGWRAEDCSHKSFISRFDKLIDEGFFENNKVDTLFIFGGTNDSWADSPLGEVKLDGWTREELFSFCPAVCYLLARAKEHLPDTRIIYIVNAGLKDKVNDAVRVASEYYGNEVIFLPMMDRNQNHPTAKGMTEIADEVEKYLKAAE